MNLEPNSGGCLGWLVMVIVGFFGFAFFGVSSVVTSPPTGMMPPAGAVVTAVPDVYTVELVFALDPLADPATLDTLTPIVGKRLAALGVNYSLATVPDRNEIIVGIDAETDPLLISEALQESALLELVDISALNESDVMLLVGQTIRTDMQGAFGITLSSDALSQPNGEPFTSIITGDAVQAAEAYLDTMSNTWGVGFTLNPESAVAFGDFTEGYIGKPLAIVLDGVILSVPTVQARIDNYGIISGNFSEDEARTLAAQLSAGPLPAPLTLQSINGVTP